MAMGYIQEKAKGSERSTRYLHSLGHVFLDMGSGFELLGLPRRLK